MNEILDRFKNAIHKDRLSHLYLLSGSTKLQKMQLAQDIAYEIFKSVKDDSNLRHLMESGNFSNYIFIEKDGLSVKKEQIMSLQKEFNKTSLVDGKRVYVIDGIETLSVSAANSLLKFLEEPKNQNTVGILLTDDISLVLPTIISRSQVVRLKEDSTSLLIDKLKADNISIKDAKLLVELTANFEEARLFVDNPQFIKSKQFIEEFIASLKEQKNTMLDLFNKIAITFNNEKEWISYILNIYSLILLDVMHMHMNLNITYDFLRDELVDLVNKYKLNQIQAMMKKLHEVNANLKLPINIFMALTALSIQIEEIIKDGNA